MLIAGFVAGGTEDVDANQETVRLLRSQLRSKSSLRVIDADVMPLQDIAQEQSKSAPDAGDEPPPTREPVAAPRRAAARQRSPAHASRAAARSASRKRRISSRTSGCSPTPRTGSASARNTRTR